MKSTRREREMDQICAENTIHDETKANAIKDFNLEDPNDESLLYPELNYRYFRAFQNDSHEIVSVGWYVTINGFVMYSVSFCGKKDFFSRKVARKWIIQRFSKKQIGAFYLTFDFSFIPIEILIKLHYNSVANKDPKGLGVEQIPKWARRIW